MTWFAVGAAAVGAVNSKTQSDAQNRASGILMDANKYSVAERRRQFDANKALRMPFYDAGLAQLPMLGGQATGEGYSNMISQLLQSGKLDPMIQQEQQQTGRMLSEAGLRRSGYGAKMMGSAPANVAMGIENQLNQRAQALSGYGQTAGANYGSAGQANANAISSLLQGQGNIQAANTAAQNQIRQDYNQNLLDLGTAYAGQRWV